MPATRKTVRAKIDKRLISEVTRFFGGWDTMLREIIQNVYRSQATRLDVTFNRDECLLVFEDNGKGCPDPQTLLSAGKTGWDEGKVKAPAGLGFFSLFDPSIVSNVLVQSHNWRLIIPPELAVSHTFDVKKLAKRQNGFRVELHLQQEFVDEETKTSYSKLDIHKFRDSLADHLTTYPFKMYFNGRKVTSDEAKALPHSVQVHSDKWGTMYLCTEWSANHHEVIWEHRMTESKVWKAALKHAAGSNPLHRWIAGDTPSHCLGGPRLIWRINTACGVQPKLPDRDDLINNGHLNRAAKAWLEIISRWYDDGRHHNWPNAVRHANTLKTKIESDMPTSVEKTERTIRNDAVEPLLLLHGWDSSVVEDVANLQIDTEGNSLDINPQDFEPLWVREGVPTLDHDLMVLRNISRELFQFEQIPRRAEEGEQAMPITWDWEPALTAAEIAEGKYMYVAPAKAIMWNGQELPYYFLTEDERDQHHVAVVIAGTPEEVGKVLEVSLHTDYKNPHERQETFDMITNWLISLTDRGDLFGQHIYDTGWEGEDTSSDSDELIQYAVMYGELREEFYQRYFPQKLELGKDLNLLSSLSDTIHAADVELTSLLNISKHRPVGHHDKVKALDKAFKAYEKKIRAEIVRVKRALKKPLK